MTPKTVAIIGASGAIGKAFIEALCQHSALERLYAFSRSPIQLDDERVVAGTIDFDDQASVLAAADTIEAPLDLCLVTTGMLHTDEFGPEKSKKALELTQMERIFKTNTFGPALCLRAFMPKMNQANPSIFAALSARVGSIGDNVYGGWYSYRASKAALNMLIKTASIEAKHRYKKTTIIGLHPGTVDSSLSKPFQSRVPEGKLFTSAYAADCMMTVLSNVGPGDSGEVFAWDGERIEH